ncbi:MAG: carbamoyltransferase family protein [Planctomycetota bacterium]|jgi:carbamoyltransferase
MTMLILGINAHHADAAAALFNDGQLIAAIEEERLNRIKHFAGFPSLAIAEVLRIAGADIRDVDQVGIARDSTANLRQKMAYVLRNLGKVRKAARKRLKDRAGLQGLEQQMAEACGVSDSVIKAKYKRVEHHLAHAASAYLVSPFEDAAILTIDGFGDFASAMLAEGKSGDIKVHSRVSYPHSLGILYTAICQFIGFDRYGDEGKIMGLAPYGEPVFEDAFEKLLKLTDKGFELELAYFNHHTEGVETGRDDQGSPHFEHLYTDMLTELFGPPRVGREELTDRERNIAASLQKRLEEAVIHLANLLQKKTGQRKLCLAGGVALNSVANAKILEHTPFEQIFIQPAAGDDGTAVGAAAILNQQAGLDRFEMKHSYWGSSFGDASIETSLQSADGFEVSRLDDEQLFKATASDIANGKVVGWFQGAMEWGPRALGNRSIVAHPGHPRMKEILNARIKHREPFRPFAPSIKVDRLGEYFDATHPAPFMLMVYGTREDKRTELCAVDHVDHTGRVQTVSQEQNPRYWALIDAFEQQTGTPVLLNTSFNENEPIVCTPQQALDCFKRTDMDVVVMGNFVCRRTI